MIYWVLDCCVIENCNEGNCNHRNYWDCIEVITNIKASDGICLDDTNEIYREYIKHIRPNTLLSSWWKLMTRTIGKTHICSAHLPRKHRTKLSKLRFHDDDIMYVGTAYNSPDRKLVSFDSDYSTDVTKYINDECNVEVIHPCNCY